MLFTLTIGDGFEEMVPVSSSCYATAALRQVVANHLQHFSADELVLAVRATDGMLVELHDEEETSQIRKLFVFTQETWADEQEVGPAVAAFFRGTGSLSDMFSRAGGSAEPRQTAPSLTQLLVQQRKEDVTHVPRNGLIDLPYTNAKRIWNASVDLVGHLAFVLDQFDQCKHPDTFSARDVVFSINPPIAVSFPSNTVVESLPGVESFLKKLLGRFRDCPVVEVVHTDTRVLESFATFAGSLCNWVDEAIKMLPGDTPDSNFSNLSIRVHQFLALSKFLLDKTRSSGHRVSS